MPAKEDRYERAFRDAPVGMAFIARNGSLLRVNAAMCALLERSEREMLGASVASVTHPGDVETEERRVADVLAGAAKGYQLEKRQVRPNGAVVWVQVDVVWVDEADGEGYFVALVHDVTARRARHEELRRYTVQLNALAQTDPLTGLSNRRELLAVIAREISRCERTGGSFALVLLDVERFGALNQSHGPLVGDAALRSLAQALRTNARAADVVARMGADEFALLLVDASREDGEAAVTRIAAAVSEDDRSLAFSHGAATYPNDGTTRELLLVRAELALHAGRRRPQPADQDPAGVAKVLELARGQLGMKVAYVATHDDHEQRFEALDGDAIAFAIDPAVPIALPQTLCHHMLEGRLPSVVADTAAHPVSASLAISAERGARAYVGVPVRLADGRLHGTLCTLDDRPRDDLGDRELELMRFLADAVAERVEHDQQEHNARRDAVELGSMQSLLAALSARDQYTSDHSHDVVALASGVARHLGLGLEETLATRQVALLHDVGKVGVPDAVLQKPGPLDEQEWTLMRAHPVIGARVLEATRSLAHLGRAVRAEHERWDGAGYPDRLAGEEIPLASRIVLACDAYHAMISDRPYRAAMPPEEARAELRRGAASQFDPQVVGALLAVLGDLAVPDAPPRGADAGIDVVLRGSASSSAVSWQPLSPPGKAYAMAEVRCECLTCGTHLPGVVSRSNLVGCCSNCGSYEVELVEG